MQGAAFLGNCKGVAKLMFVFGHIGITLGAAVVISGSIQAIRIPNNLPGRPALPLKSWIESLGRFLDIRLLVIGSLLPDIIDKPIGIFLFGDGRVFMHSLVVSCLITLAALYLYLRRRQTRLLALAGGMVSHLVLDSMWLSPYIFYWPGYGWAFPLEVTNYLDIWLEILMHNPAVDITEGLGLIITMSISWYLMKQKKFMSILVRGRI